MVRRSSLNLNRNTTPKKYLRIAILGLSVFAIFMVACSETPTTTSEHLAQGDKLLARGDIGDAIASYRMAMHLDTLNPQVYARLAQAYKAQNKEVAADRYLRRAMNIPYEKGIRALEAGDDSTAASSFEATLDIFPRHPLALTRLAEIYQARNQFDKALVHLEKAVEANPQYPATHVKLGQLYALQNAPEKAKDAFKRQPHKSN